MRLSSFFQIKVIRFGREAIYWVLILEGLLRIQTYLYALNVQYILIKIKRQFSPLQ